jgi:glycosyltransferase involved in cell wall biosynthesis
MCQPAGSAIRCVAHPANVRLSEKWVMPAVSTIITTYNRAQLLPRAIESAMKAASDLEVIVVDDCSTDETADVCARIEGIRYVRLSRNQGLANARNVGIAECASDFIALLDDDDLRLPGSLDKQLAVLKASDNAAFCYGQALIGDGNFQPASSIRSHVRRATSSGSCSKPYSRC